jgi:hypothetical protein
LLKNPGPTIVAAVTIALGAGANIAMFSVVNGVLLRPLPYPDADRIMEIALDDGQTQLSSFSAKQFGFWQKHGEPFQQLAAMTPVAFSLAGVSRPERVRALRVSTRYFDVLGARPDLGRGFLPDERPGGPNVVIVSHGLRAVVKTPSASRWAPAARASSNNCSRRTCCWPCSPRFWGYSSPMWACTPCCLSFQSIYLARWTSRSTAGHWRSALWWRSSPVVSLAWRRQHGPCASLSTTR